MDTQYSNAPGSTSSATWNQSNTADVLAATIIMLILMPLCIGLRIWSARLQNERLDTAAWCVIAAFLVSVANFGLAISLTHRLQDAAAGGQSWEPGLYEMTMKTFLAAEILGIMGLALSKLSVIFLYRKIFPTRVMCTGTILLGAFTLIWAIVLTFFLAFACSPPSAFWDASRRHGEGYHCLNVAAIIAYGTVPSIIADIALLILPIREISGLQMDRSKQFKIGGIFSLGSIVTVIAIVRLCITISQKTYQQGLSWTAAELGLSVMCACLPAIGSAIHRIFGSHKVPSGSQRIASGRQKALPSLPTSQAPRDPMTSSNPVMGFWRRMIKKIQDAVGWQSMPVVDVDQMERNASASLHMRNLSMHSEADSSHKKAREVTHLENANGGKFRNSAEMEEFRRLYEYSGTNPFSHDAYAQMTDSELFGGIMVEQRVDWTVEQIVEEEPSESAVGTEEQVLNMPARVYDGRNYSTRDMV